jgi:acetyltransferase
MTASVASYSATVVLRPLRRGDVGAVLEVFGGLGLRSRAQRFLTAKPRLTSADLRQLTAVDGRDHVAVLAVSAATGRPVGVARFVRDPAEPSSADVAVEVVDAWQDCGVGTMLAADLVRRAWQLGVRRLTMAMAPDNEGAVRLLHRVPGEIERLSIDEHTAEFAITLREPGSAQVDPRPAVRVAGANQSCSARV